MKSSKLRMCLVTISGTFGMKRTLLIGASILAFTGTGFAQTTSAQQFEAYQANWKQTHGLQELDQAQYEQMKTDYSLYLFNSQSPEQSTAQTSSVQLFEAFQAEWKQTHGLQQLDQTQYAQMKADYAVYLANYQTPEQIARHDAYLLERGLPAGFPVKHYTGDDVIDDAIYQAEKQVWIDNNAALYEQIVEDVKPTAAQDLERVTTLQNQNN